MNTDFKELPMQIQNNLATTVSTNHHDSGSDALSLQQAIRNAWRIVAPSWPLRNIIATNPLAGFEDCNFEDALRLAQAYFQQKSLPSEMSEVNRECIKWLQVFFDHGQSTISMPGRQNGFLAGLLVLLQFDSRIHKGLTTKLRWLQELSDKPETIILQTLLLLGISNKDFEQFLTLMLTTLPGWSAYVKYRTEWADAHDTSHPHPVTQTEYLAFRLVVTCLLWPDAKSLLTAHRMALRNANVSGTLNEIAKQERMYQERLSNQLVAVESPTRRKRMHAQFVFCIDVRSEPFRRALEAQGDYETFGFAGFFGIPISLQHTVTGENYASCPVLLKPQATVFEKPAHSADIVLKRYQCARGVKAIYQSLKYTFTTPLNLVEMLGPFSGVWMGIRTLLPKASGKMQVVLNRFSAGGTDTIVDYREIPFQQQVAHAVNALSTIGLTEHFAPIVVLCGHGSTSQNNPYATALDCGACAGRHGGPNARVLASILNSSKIRRELINHGISIPYDTLFIGAQHNTTTDEVVLYEESSRTEFAPLLQTLKMDLSQVRTRNSEWRSQKLNLRSTARTASHSTHKRSQDWAQVRPEWGLAGNAAFIVGPRWLTESLDLEGRTFLHSYNWKSDEQARYLTAIMTAPMIVGQWINAQYLFSTLDNVAFGAGSKITLNITGKIGVMQGNASDLMHGLPLQSVFQSDDVPYHTPMRLTVVVYAPRSRIDGIVQANYELENLFRNEWIHLLCYDPVEYTIFKLEPSLTWTTQTTPQQK